MADLVYNASPTMQQFHGSDAFVRALLGPIGSGKSVACCIELIRRAMQQEPTSDGLRKSRWAVIRNTYRELIDTTMLTFFDWIPKDHGLYRAMDMKFTYYDRLSDGTIVQAEFLFRALDKPDDIKKLLSLELTGGWLNECREIPKEVLDMLIGRLGRFPSKRDGGPTWFGVICDTNPPDSDHWFYNLFEENRPSKYELFHQPSGVGKNAENIENLPDDYYENMIEGKDQEWINVYVHGQYGFIADGKPVYPEYKDDVHHLDIDFTPESKSPIYVGIDFGLTPAACFVQENAAGRLIVFNELVTEDMGAKTFSQLLNQLISNKYSDYQIYFYGDPSGDIRAQTDEVTPFQILAANGIIAWPTYTNDFIVRRESVAASLMRLDFAGNPGFGITNGAPLFRKGMAGGYKYRRMAVPGRTAMYQDKPDKGRYSHVCEAGQYAFLGMGQGTKLLETPDSNKEIDYSQMNRMVV